MTNLSFEDLRDKVCALTGGVEGINKSLYLRAARGIERMMGRADTPMREVLNYTFEHFAKELPIVYVQTGVGMNDAGNLETKGLFVGVDVECFNYADLEEMMKKYNPAKLKDGFNMVDGEEIFYISNPAIGLWAYKERFK